jgi:2-hydroxy-3-keto-5-methylthiopentenyl-1-phosphate phosphatase
MPSSPEAGTRAPRYPSDVLPGSGIAAVLVDFDGTACAHDAALHVLQRFGADGWAPYDDAAERGEIDLREAISGQAALVRGDDTEMLGFVLDHCPMEPTFRPFVEWCAGHGVRVTLVSDGFGFYVTPLLRAHGIHDVDVVTNTWRRDLGGRPHLVFTNGHPECVGCGTCKLQAVVTAREALGPVAFVGNGYTDRYGALYADIVFAKDRLAETCLREGVPSVPWRAFDDVRDRLVSDEPLPGPVAPVRCPGWTPA